MENAYRIPLSRGGHSRLFVRASLTSPQGLVLSTVTYNDAGRVRPLFYRLSLAEMGEHSVARYNGALTVSSRSICISRGMLGSTNSITVILTPRQWPHPRKFAFDVGEYKGYDSASRLHHTGEYGLGVLANELMLGKCCKGAIQ